ncbi:TRAP transporter small permease [Hoeflea poritis]|uniref:TRAP transporter small permease protein n=1 Tax=Hoeflea poritis TaxID=2993659 RepID=A0ABT4VKC6_9HYPH|nr:TRAP transporter small permease subunit [Hoeflea poritis]MDA4845049.1 TRAP transporter small permease subunit [Hoeflea poritis]
MNDGNDKATGSAGPVERILSAARRLILYAGIAIFSTTLSALFVALFVNVVLRYAFDRGISWAYEIPYILFPWAVGGAIIVASCLGRNIQINLFANLVPLGSRRLIGTCVNGLVLLICLVVVWTATPILNASKFMRLAETGIPQFYGMSGLVVAFVAVAIVSAIDLVHLLLGAPYLDGNAPEKSLS